MGEKIKIVAISDVHGKQKDLIIPKCDILISAGDYSMVGDPREVYSFHEWLNEQDAKHVISVQGNHELWVEKNFNLAHDIAKKVCPRIHFIDEGPVDIEGLKIWCSAITPYFWDWAWNKQRGPDIKRHWDFIPDDTDILITHGPPYGYGDNTPSSGRVGCRDLMDAVLRVKPKYHIFGHIHPEYGIYNNEHTTFINASSCNNKYKAVNAPVEFEI